MKIQINIAQLQAARQFAATNDVRYYLNGVRVESIKGITRLIATDGAVCAIQTHQGDPSDEWSEATGIPNDACDDMIKRARARRLDFVAIVSQGEKFEAIGLDMLFKKLEGVFPDYRRIVPFHPSGEVGQFDPAMLARFQKAAKVLKGGLIWIDHGGENGAAAVRILGIESFLGVLMPVRRKKDSAPLESISTFAARFK